MVTDIILSRSSFATELLLLSHQELLDLLLDGGDLGLDLGALVLGDGGGDDRPGHPAGPAQRLLASNKDVGHVLVLAEQGDVEEDLQGLGVGGQDHKLALPPVEGLGGLIGALAHLLVVDSLLRQVEDLGGEGLVRQRVRLRVHLDLGLLQEEKHVQHVDVQIEVIGLRMGHLPSWCESLVTW